MCTSHIPSAPVRRAGTWACVPIGREVRVRGRARGEGKREGLTLVRRERWSYRG